MEVVPAVVSRLSERALSRAPFSVGLAVEVLETADATSVNGVATPVHSHSGRAGAVQK